MKLFKYAMGCSVALLLATGCDTKATSEAAKTADVDTAAVEVPAAPSEAEIQAANEAVLTQLYDNFVLLADLSSDAERMSEAEQTEFINAHLSAEVQKRLRDLYDMDGDGMAFWELRSGAQDGDGDSKVTGIKALGDNWYQVDYLDMGFAGHKDFQVENGVIMNFR